MQFLGLDWLLFGPQFGPNVCYNDHTNSTVLIRQIGPKWSEFGQIGQFGPISGPEYFPKASIMNSGQHPGGLCRSIQLLHIIGVWGYYYSELLNSSIPKAVGPRCDGDQSLHTCSSRGPKALGMTAK